MSDLDVQFRPLYLQVRDKLRALIAGGTYRPGDRLPSEPELCRMFRTSRSTVREAVRSLEEEGVLHIRQGVGTFVRQAAVVESGLEELHSVTQFLRQMGFAVGAKDTRTWQEACDGRLAGLLDRPAGSPLVCVQRIRTANGQPLVLSVNKLPADLVGDSLAQGLEGSLFAHLETRCGVRIAYSVATVAAVEDRAPVAAAMGLRRPAPILVLEQVHYGEDDRPVFYAEDYYRNDLFKFRLVRRRRPAP